MKLKVMQQGGGLIYTPFIPDRSSGQTTSKSSKSDEDSEKIDPIDKEIISLMKEHELLPSDIQLIYDKLIKFHKQSQDLSNSYASSSDKYNSVMPSLISIMKMVSQAKLNKSDWDSKLSEIRKHDAGSEVALDSYGRMWVQNTENGEIEKISPNKYDDEKYTPISNSQLMYLRQRNPGFAFRDDLLGDTGMDVVGNSDVRKEIDEIIDKFGTIKSSELKKGNFKEIAQDLQGDGIFKITSKYSKAELEDFSGLLFSRLSAPAKHLIIANAKIGGYEPLKYIYSIITSETDTENDISYEASLTKANALGGSGGSGTDGDEKNLVADTYIEELVRGNNFELPRLTYFNPTSKTFIAAMIQNTGDIKKDDGKTSVGAGMLDAILEQVSFKQISPQTTVTFGDQLIDEKNANRLMYDGSALQRVDLPYTQENGEITVDWSTIEAVEEANKQLKSKSVTEGMIKDLVEQNPKLVWNENTKRVEAKNHMWFLTFTAMIADDYATNDIDFSSPYLEKMSQDKADFWHAKYEEAIQYGFVQHDKNAPKRTDVPTDKWGWPIKLDWTKTHYYHGNVFIPIINQLAGAVEYSPKSSRLHNSQTQAAAQRAAEIQEQTYTGQRSFNW